MIVSYDADTNLYVTEDGVVLKEVRQWSDKDGYKYITANRKNVAVHRLVANHYVRGKTPEKRIVMHRDDNPSNNHYTNLEWGTYSQNNYDAYARGLKTTNIKVRCMETGETFHSARDAATKMFGIPKRGDRIADAARTKRATAYGYHWEVVS